MTYCLGIESTAHTFAIGIVRINDKEILANIRRLFTTEEGGIVPSELAEHHVEAAPEVLRAALDKAGITIKDVSLIAYAHGPGMGHALRVGAALARSLAIRHGIPLVGVNHCVAHLEIGKVLGNERDPVLLYVSGANTQVIAEEGGKYRLFGETLDLGTGNFLDTIAREMGLGFPGGPKIEALALQHDKSLLDLPYAVKGMDVSLSGIQTAVKRLLAADTSKEMIAFSVQETVFAMLCEVAERALAHTGKESLVLGGGVACNARLQEMCKEMCVARGVRFFCPAREYLVDNGVMIALLGISVHKAGFEIKPSVAGVDPYERTDEALLPQ